MEYRCQEVQKGLRLASILQSGQGPVRLLEIEIAFSNSRPKIEAVIIEEEEQHRLLGTDTGFSNIRNYANVSVGYKTNVPTAIGKQQTGEDGIRKSKIYQR